MESQHSSVSMLSFLCKSKDILYRSLSSADKTMDYIRKSIVNKSCLIISANNEYIFPGDICALKNVVIINFHYSYLPKYRGMNIPTWVIFNGEENTGVSWHYVNKDIDSGEIIAREKIKISENDKAIDIVKKGMIIGRCLFEKIIEKLLTGDSIDTVPNLSEGTVYYSRSKLPCAGYLEEMRSALEIGRLLRAFDYGATQYIKPLKFVYDGKEYKILKYRIWCNGILLLGDTAWQESYVIKKENYQFDLLLKE